MYEYNIINYLTLRSKSNLRRSSTIRQHLWEVLRENKNVLGKFIYVSIKKLLVSLEEAAIDYNKYIVLSCILYRCNTVVCCNNNRPIRVNVNKSISETKILELFLKRQNSHFLQIKMVNIYNYLVTLI